ncbi:MAG: MFS transporter [Candidatus Brocadiia bacterium]|jgi:MFS family permease
MIQYLESWRIRVRNAHRNLLLFAAGAALMGFAGTMFDTTFNNFLSDTFNLSAEARGNLEFPRELPGFLCALFAGLLFFTSETNIAGISALCVGAGLIGVAIWGGGWSAMMALMILWSVGSHLIMPVRSSISMDLAPDGKKGRRLGQIQGASIAASIVGYALIWVVMDLSPKNYRLIYIIGGVVALGAAAVFFAMRMPGAHLSRPKFIFRRRYWLYYLLAAFFGARKQIFITFGPWVLVQIFHQEANIFAELFMAGAVLGLVFQPALGRAIDRFGERKVLMVDAMLIFCICAGYGFADHLGNHRLALWLLYACFVADQLLFGVNMARDTYMSKIALKPEHVAPSLSLGITINHAVSMSVPSIGGLVWIRYGYSWVFVGAACVAVLMVIFTSMVRTDRPK